MSGTMEFHLVPFATVSMDGAMDKDKQGAGAVHFMAMLHFTLFGLSDNASSLSVLAIVFSVLLIVLFPFPFGPLFPALFFPSPLPLPHWVVSHRDRFPVFPSSHSNDSYFVHFFSPANNHG